MHSTRCRGGAQYFSDGTEIIIWSNAPILQMRYPRPQFKESMQSALLITRKVAGQIWYLACPALPWSTKPASGPTPGAVPARYRPARRPLPPPSSRCHLARPRPARTPD